MKRRRWKPEQKALFRLDKHQVRLCDLPNGEKVFFLLREPTSRFVSAFNSRLPMVVHPSTLLISLMPISIAGLGVRQAGFVYFLGLAGMPAEIALPLALIQRLFTILVTLPGAWWYARRGLHE